jgi:hypothetical protein
MCSIGLLNVRKLLQQIVRKQCRMTSRTSRITSFLILVLAQALLIHTDVIAPFAGDYYLGDGGNPTSATLNAPYGLAVDSSNNLVYIADSYNHIIRVVNRTSNIISTVAGTHFYSGSSGDGKRYASNN